MLPIEPRDVTRHTTSPEHGFQRGDQTIAVVTIGRDLESLRAEIAMGRGAGRPLQP